MTQRVQEWMGLPAIVRDLTLYRSCMDPPVLARLAASFDSNKSVILSSSPTATIKSVPRHAILCFRCGPHGCAGTVSEIGLNIG